MSLAARLRSCPQLSDLEPKEIESLADAVAVIEAKDGAIIVKQGDRGDACYLILEGEITVFHQHPGGETVLKTLGAGELFGLVSLIDHGQRSATCRAKGATTLAKLEASAFQFLHEGSPSLALHFQRLVARQLARDARSLNAALVNAMLANRATGGGGASGEFHLASLD